MNIDSMKVAIRPMSTAQALDLGMAMARHWFVPLWQIWLGMALPIYVLFYLGGMLLNINFGVTMGAFGGLVFWWLKPIYEKPMIAWLGQALFTEPPPIKHTIKSGWRSAKSYGFILLFKKRLSLQRQLMLPILMLEKPSKAQFKMRLSILARGQGGGLSWHTIVLVNIETILSIAAVILLWQLIPTGMVKTDTLFTILEYQTLWLELAWGALYFLAASIIAPFFVASGFAVYLTKRCLLEGWDVELVFKQLRGRYQASQASPLAELQESGGLSHLNNLDGVQNNTQSQISNASNTAEGQ